MNVLYRDGGRTWHSSSGIDALAEFVHPDAAVAWDRDCQGVRLYPEEESSEGCSIRMTRSADAGVVEMFSGPPGRLVATWFCDELRWTPAPPWEDL